MFETLINWLAKIDAQFEKHTIGGIEFDLLIWCCIFMQFQFNHWIWTFNERKKKETNEYTGFDAK